MNNYTIKAISQEELNAAKTKGAHDLMKARRRIVEMTVIAENFNGAYVTKALVPKLKAYFPKADRLYLDDSKYSTIIQVNFGYGADYNNHDEFTICTKENRRIDAQALLAIAHREKEEAEAYENALNRLEETVKQYNKIADAYAEVASEINRFFDIPYADYEMEQKYRGSISPEQFEGNIQ